MTIILYARREYMFNLFIIPTLREKTVTRVIHMHIKSPEVIDYDSIELFAGCLMNNHTLQARRSTSLLTFKDVLA